MSESNLDTPLVEKKSLIKTVFKFVGLLIAAILGFGLFGSILYSLFHVSPSENENWLGLIFAFMMMCFGMFFGGLIGLSCTDELLEMFGLWKYHRQKIGNFFDSIGNFLEKILRKPLSWLEQFFKIIGSIFKYFIIVVGYLIALGFFLLMIYVVIWVIGYIFGQGFRNA